LGTAFYRGAEACILVFDITNNDSFDHLPFWKSNFLDKATPKDPKTFPFFVFGNKKDMERDRTVSVSKYREW
jgi:Ras-related protein Rab-7A